EREQYFEIQDLKAQLQDKNIAISELKKLIEKGKGKSVNTKFDKPSVVRQPNAQRILKPSVLDKPTPFSNSLERIYFSKTKSIPKTNVSKGLSKPVTTQTLTQTTRKAVCNTNVLKPGMYQINNRSTQTRAPQLPQTVRNTNPRVSTSTGVNHKTNVSRPQHKSNQLKDNVLPNNSQVKLKKTQVEVLPRIPSVSNKMKSIAACKDSLNSKTLNANAVCATSKKCLVDSNHFVCVTKMLNDVNARTKKPNIVQLILFIVDSGCMKHMTGNLKLLCNFVEKFLGTVVFAMISLRQFLDMEIWFKEISRSIGNLHVLLEIFRVTIYSPVIVDLISTQFLFKNQHHQLHSVSWLRPHQLKHGYGIKAFSSQLRLHQSAFKKGYRDRGTEFLNKTLNTFFKEEEIKHQTSTAQTLNRTALLKDETILWSSDEFPLPDYFPTANEDRFPLLSERDAPAKEVYTANEVKD
nr:hypothetical protein [Tanacetum cinerariifolium]